MEVIQRCVGISALFFVLNGVLIAVGADNNDTSPAPAKEAPKSPFEVPMGDVKELVAFVDEMKLNRPRTRAELKALLTAVKTAADRILELEEDKKSETYKRFTQEALVASAQLIGSLPADEQRSEIKRVLDILKDRPFSRLEAQLTMTVARAAELGDDPELAAKTILAAADLMRKGKEAEMHQAAEMLVGAARRVKSVGQVLELKGTQLDGAPFDIKSLQGKVVLVDFWATWCGPCRAEFPNILKNYETYHEQGFEVVGVSIDSDRSALEKFVEESKVPWMILHEKDSDGENPATKHYGIFGIPAMFLIGRDGKVISIRARGDELSALLKKEMAP